jgi:YqjK-like protein
MKAPDHATELSERRERLLLVVAEQRQQLAQQLAPIFRGASVVDGRVAAVRSVVSSPLVIGAVGVTLLLIGPRRALGFIKRGTKVWLVARNWLPLLSTVFNRRT